MKAATHHNLITLDVRLDPVPLSQRTATLVVNMPLIIRA